MSNTSEESGFSGLGIAPGILRVLHNLKFISPTPIQLQAIPVANDGKDVMGIAQTGTGKTLAFGLPLIQNALKGAGMGLVVVPTRELAEQVGDSLRKVGFPLGIRTATLIGGEPIYRQHRQLRARPQIIIGTPGRIIDHLKQKTVHLGRVTTLVLDEADRMLDMGFAPQLADIVRAVPTERQTMLFSATMPDQVVQMANTYMKTPIRVEIALSGTTAEKVTQEVFFVDQAAKSHLLKKILEEYRGSVLVFIRTKFGAKKIAATVRAMGYHAAELHSNRSLPQRREALQGFKTGKYRVLIATDIAARGIDVSNIELVINYDLPENAEDYVHRIGRTARAGVAGHAISFARPHQRQDVRSIERLIRYALPVSELPALPDVPRDIPPLGRESSGRRQGGRKRSFARSFHSRPSHRRRRF